MFDRRSGLAALTAGILTLAACSQSTETTPLSPSPVTRAAASITGGNSTLKVGVPLDLGPNDIAVGETRPTLTFTNPAGLFANVGLAYEIDVQNAAGETIYSRVIGESPGTSGHTLDTELAAGQTFWWRVRGRLGDDAGPWSDFAVFHVHGGGGGGAPRPAPGGPLPFALPGECGPFGPGDRSACVAVMAAVSPWWPACSAGSAVDCHRFTRSVAAALAVHDSGWGLISKNPGEQQCTWDGCGPGGGAGYGEDIVAYHTGGGNWIGWDIVAGAGAPGAGAHWSPVSGRRAGNDWRPVPPFP